MGELSIHWHWHPDVMLWVLLIEGVYLLAVGPVRRRFDLADGIERSKVALFSLGVLTLYIAEGTPIHEISEQYLFSMHMTQHILLTMVMTPLMLLGTPEWLLRPLIHHRRATEVARVITHPLLTFGLFNGALAVWHVPELYELTLQDHNIHVLEHVVFISTSLLAWWPVLGPLPELRRLGYLAQIIYLFLLSLLPAVLGGMITFSREVVYGTYALAPRLWGMSAVVDQQIGGLIMKVVGTIIIWLVITVIFFTWFNREEAETPGPLRLDDVEQELGYMGLTKR